MRKNVYSRLIFVYVSVLLVGALLLSCGWAPEGGGDSGSTQQISKAYGGSRDELPFALLATSDNGVIVGGYTESFGEGSRDSLFFKLDSRGELLWQYTMGGADIEDIQSIAEAPDGGYMLCGYTQSFGNGEYDIWLVKLNKGGSIEWQKTYGGAGTEYCKSAEYTSDGGLIVAGYSDSWGSGARDIWVLKLSADGDIAWQHAYGTSDAENTYSIHETSDGGYLIAGGVHPPVASSQLLVLKLNHEGGIEWQNIYGDKGLTHTFSAVEASSGGYVVAAYSDMGGAGRYDVLMLRLANDGSLKWSNYYGGPNDEFAYVVREIRPDEFLVAGGMANDMMTLSVDGSGALTGLRSFGGVGEDLSSAYSVAQSSEGVLFAGAKSRSWGLGGYDIWIVSRSSAKPLGMDSHIAVTTASPVVLQASLTMSVTDSASVQSNVAQRPLAMDVMDVPIFW